MIRLGQTVSRDADRTKLANEIAPFEQQKQWLENAVIAIDKTTLAVEQYILQNS